MKIGVAGINLIKRMEGLVLTAYKDVAGILTIGYGHTGKDVTAGLVITEEQATKLLKEDVTTAEKAVNDCVTVTINQNQFDALVSFTFNIGSAALKKSTLVKKLNVGDFTGAAKEFLKWDKVTVNGKKVQSTGLTKRREAEKELFESNNFLGVEEVTTEPKEEQKQVQVANTEMKVKVTVKALRIRKQPTTKAAVAGVIRDMGVYTIVEVSGEWGKLKSGAGWICLTHTKKI